MTPTDMVREIEIERTRDDTCHHHSGIAEQLKTLFGLNSEVREEMRSLRAWLLGLLAALLAGIALNIVVTVTTASTSRSLAKEIAQEVAVRIDRDFATQNGGGDSR